MWAPFCPTSANGKTVDIWCAWGNATSKGPDVV
jgi:hypothetical protein